MNKTYKIQLPRNKEAQNIRTNIKDGTIEVEVELKEKWEPRDGDICFITSHYSFISVFKSQENNDIHTYIDFLVDDNLLVNSVNSNLCSIANIKEFRPATDSEKQLLFDALAKKGKMWDAQKKAVVDLPRWRAERDCRYYYIKNCDATIHPGNDNRFEVDNNLYESGNYFKTKEAAERVAEQIREIFKNSKAE